MNQTEQYFESISKSLESLVEVQKQNNQFLQMLIESLTGKNLSAVLNTPVLAQQIKRLIPNSGDHTPYSRTHELFMQVTKVYMEEEALRLANFKRKKAARRVSINIGTALEDFFMEQLDDDRITVERAKDGLIVFYKEEKPCATLKFMTDLGFHRGEGWYDYIKAVVKESQEIYGVPNDRVYFIVSSLRNGIEKPHVEKLLGRSISSNWDFLTDDTAVDEFLDRYLAGVPALADPMKQVYFMAAAMHPNVLGDELYDSKKNESEYARFVKAAEDCRWLSDINDLIGDLNQKI
ncbi:hypothetical protein OS242_01705 [Tumebacillus sp. DT12]|uniref:Uncharacterized protein n=1 Tax=Tumebacillus lacus TaxID=2995335 RepID=A0ABT3WVI3_9BACL|nr:hypothetical protein [Tumebacillus lacus]MCX7568685.1 hypothetical protein [Tumebacillus lacus]